VNDVRDGAAGNANHRGRSILALPFDDQTIEGGCRAQEIGQLEPLLGVGVESAEMGADQLHGGGISEHRQQGGIGVQQIACSITAADTIGSIGHERAEIYFGAAQTFLRRTQSGVEPADQSRQNHE